MFSSSKLRYFVALISFFGTFHFLVFSLVWHFICSFILNSYLSHIYTHTMWLLQCHVIYILVKIISQLISLMLNFFRAAREYSWLLVPSETLRKLRAERARGERLVTTHSGYTDSCGKLVWTAVFFIAVWFCSYLSSRYKGCMRMVRCQNFILVAVCSPVFFSKLRCLNVFKGILITIL